MEFRPKSTFEYRTTKNDSTYRCFNNFRWEKIHQSPKICSKKLRYLSYGQKLYSLNDINDKITNSKGPKLSKQYKRLTDKELDKCFGNDKLIGWNQDKLFIKKYFKTMKSTKNEINSRNNKHLIIDSEENKNCKKTELSKNENNKNNEKSNTNVINSYTNKRIFLKRPSTGEEKKLNKIIPATERNDIWMPKNFKNYDLLVKNPRMINTKSAQDEMLKKIPSFSYNEIRKKMNDTDVFFSKEQKITRNLNKRVKSSYIFSESDIFCRKHDKVNLSKSGEIYLFKTNLGKKYTTSNESNSRWQPGSNYPNLINHPSTNFNILSPDVKNCQYNRTKQTIFEECKNFNKIKIEDGYQKKALFFNPTHKQKGIGEFIDITKNGAGNPGRDFINKYKENPLCFQRNSEVCATFGDVYYNYRNVSTKPFIKERFES